MASIVAISNQKGGVGKTTTCVNLAAYVAMIGKRVLIVDLDPQANATSSLGVFDKKHKNTICDVLHGSVSAESCILKSEIDNLDFIPSCQNLALVEDYLSTFDDCKEFVLKEALAPILNKYDFVFLDCPPAINLITVNALACTSGVLIPIQSEYFALEGLSQMMNTIKLVKQILNDNIKIYGIVLTMFDGRSKLSKDVLLHVQKLFGDKVFETKIPRNIRLAEAPSFGKTISQYDKKCAGAVAYNALALEFMQKTKE